MPLKLPVSIVPGYHVNSNKPTESYLIPLSIKWTPGPIEAGETVFPKPGMEKYEFSKTPLSVFTGNFALQTTLKATASVPVGPATLSGKLRYQACNDKACFPPKTIEVNIPVQVQ